MQNTTHYNLKKPDYTDFADIKDINDNMDTIDAELAAPTGDGRDQTVSFTDADLDSGINSFPNFLTKIVSGMKLAKFLRDFKAGMAYVLHVGSLVNNATCTESGKALDARMGKTLQDQITSLNDSLVALRSRNTAGGYITVNSASGRWSVRTFNGLGTAFLFFDFTGATSNIGMNTTLFTVPDTVKPTGEINLAGVVVTNSNVIVHGAFSISANGAVSQNASSLCRSGWGFGYYFI